MSISIEPVTCPWAHENEIRRLRLELEDAKAKLRKAQEASSYWVEFQRALGRVDDLEADRARLFQRALGAETRLEATQKIIDTEKARADGWRMRWEAAQEQITRWFKASGEVEHLAELCRDSYYALHDGFFGGEWAHIVKSQPEICWAAAKEAAEAHELLPKLHKIVAAWMPPSKEPLP